jgi:hypothetical protein
MRRCALEAELGEFDGRYAVALEAAGDGGDPTARAAADLITTALDEIVQRVIDAGWSDA